MTTKLKVGALAIVLLAMAALIVRQQQQIKRMIAEGAALRDQVEQAAIHREENQRLADQAKAADDHSQADRGELLRLRAQSSKLHQVEQENAQLKIERQRLADQVARGQQAATLSVQRPAPTNAKATPAPTEATDLGVLELTDGTPLRVGLGANKACLVMPKALADGGLDLVITFEAKDADGNISELGHPRVIARPGQQISAAVGDTVVRLTPKLKTP